MRPLIALADRRGHSEPLCEAVEAAGGEPLILDGPGSGPGPGAAAAGDLVSRLARTDGLLLPGGDDDRDIAAIAAARELGLPVLAVGRGTRILNVAFGGSLGPHPRAGDTVRPVDVMPGSRLHAATGRTRLEAAGCRDQSLARLGPGLMVSAIAAGGGVEAVETGDIIAVHWHPQDRAATSETDAALFADLVERSARTVAA
ncbi:MAG: gamma-glutamyl-gamma-aminobutyrate hydrolase family protein [Streptosporangiales bacterium]|nr:gamma-glutamyl-gamma-aminobutyrate hydrolase family protein [Streptosporangiales bacterium]